MFPIFHDEFRKDKMENSQATIIASIILYNISRDLREEVPELPSTITSAEFDELMANSFDNTPSRLRDQNYYIRDQVVTKHFAPQVRQ